MSEPQLSIRSARARELATKLSRRTGLPVTQLVEQALERYDRDLGPAKALNSLDAVWQLAEVGRAEVRPGATSAHDDLYDDTGAPV